MTIVLAAALLCLGGCMDLFMDAVVRTGGTDTETNTTLKTNDTATDTTEAGGRQRELLGRGIVAVAAPGLGVYVGWRLLAEDPPDIVFNLYRDNHRINDAPIRDTTDFVDPNGTPGAFYFVLPVLHGEESDRSESVPVLTNPYREISLPGEFPVYRAGVGDLDGDGEYDYVLIRPKPVTVNDVFPDASPETFKIEGYERHGGRRWQIDLGWNIELGETHGPMVVYDLDGDGVSEIVVKTAEGTTDGTGNPIGDVNGDSIVDYRDNYGRVLSGPEFLSVFSGGDGRELARTDWIPRGDIASWGGTTGEQAAHHFMGVAYLDGVRPSIIIVRGISQHQEVCAFDYVEQTLRPRWDYCWSSLEAGFEYQAQGYHSLRAGDVDGDGRDEVILGAYALDDDGRSLWTTGQGHGNSSVLTDINPARQGVELWSGQGLFPTGKHPLTLRDAATGTLLFGTDETINMELQVLAADIDPAFSGMEMWGSRSDLWSSDSGAFVGVNPGTCNFAVYWDGDPLRELLDTGTVGFTDIYKWSYEQQALSQLEAIEGEVVGLADVFGDWREEIIASTPGQLRIYTTITPADRRIVTLMHDALYRLGVATETMGTMQTPHTGFFIGDGMATP